jgi:MoaA/NifB/PqqE/SkfB family radical SAM enzyme
MKQQFTKEKYFWLGQVPKWIWAIIDGRNILDEQERQKVVDLRVMTSACLRNCFHCFTDKMEKTLSLQEIKDLINQLSSMKVKAIDFLGEGEPTLDKDFFEIIEYTKKLWIHPIIYTDAATMMTDRNFVKKVKQIWASVVPKCDSLRNADYQNWVVWDKKGQYFTQRNEAIKILIEEWFNEIREDGSTRLWFDMVVSRKNMHEVEKTLRYCRDNNIRIIFAFFLPSWRSWKDDFDKELMLTETEKDELRSIVQKIDKEEYWYIHPIYNNFITTPCVEFIQVYWNGNVSPCPGNEHVIGNIKETSIQDLEKRILMKYPRHNCETFDGQCLYRPFIKND